MALTRSHPSHYTNAMTTPTPRHYLVIESTSKAALSLIRKHSHLVGEAYPEANIADMMYPGDRDDYYYFGYHLPAGALKDDREEIAAIFRSFLDAAKKAHHAR